MSGSVAAMQLPDFPFVVLDTETTGFIPKTNRIIEFASVRVEKSEVVDTYEQLLSIDSEIPAEVQVLTRIKQPDLEGEPTFDAKRSEVLEHIGENTLIVGQNVSFDIGMLKGEEIDLTDRPWIDTSMLASMLFPEFESYSLGYMSTVLQLNHEPVHRALGDVRATLELLSKCWERLLQLPAEEQENLQRIFSKSTPGYALLAAAVPEATATDAPTWLTMPAPTATQNKETSSEIDLPRPDSDAVELIEEPPQANILSSILRAASAEPGIQHWIGVKNIEATVRRYALSTEARVLFPSFLLLNPTGKDELLAQDTFSADEATLAVKLLWYKPYTMGDIPIHGAEPAVWNAKLACTDDSPVYVDQFSDLPSVIVLDHRQLLSFLADPDHTAHGALQEGAHVIIDDASMLEDTATKAYGWYCDLDTLRAAAEGHSALTKFADLVHIWAERTRNYQDIRYITVGDLGSPDVAALRKQAATLLEDSTIAPTSKRLLSHLSMMLDAESLQNRIAYIELRYNGKLVIHSAPEKIGSFLQDNLYNTFSVSLLVPPHSNEQLQEIIPRETAVQVRSDLWDQFDPPFAIEFPEDMPLDSILSDPPAGKTIILAASKRSIDDVFVRYAEDLERQNITLICQGFNGGIGRTRAEFLAADEPTVWLLTPWAYEGVDLPKGSVDTLCLMGLPFDHPSHAIFSKRSEHYRNPFADYSLPRMLHRIFRLLRNYSSQCTDSASVLVLDNRIRTKQYGKKVFSYLSHFLPKARLDKADDDHLALF